MKRKVFKGALLFVISILVLYFTFMIGRYSWLIEKPSFLLSTKEKFWVHKAKEELLKDGFSQERLKSPSVRRTVIVYFKNEAGNNTVEVTLEQTSGNLLGWSGLRE